MKLINLKYNCLFLCKEFVMYDGWYELDKVVMSYVWFFGNL